jgi:hypothetical protein
VRWLSFPGSARQFIPEEAMIEKKSIPGFRPGMTN